MALVIISQITGILIDKKLNITNRPIQKVVRFYLSIAQW